LISLIVRLPGPTRGQLLILYQGVSKRLGAIDLILCGKQAIDGDTAQVGPGVAEMLGLPFVAWVRKIEEIRKNQFGCSGLWKKA